MKKISLTLLLIASFAIKSYSQQIPLFGQYYINPFIYNPSLTGQDKQTKIFLIHRNQWSSLPGAPVTNIFSVDAPIFGNKLGVGINLSNDVSGLLTRTGILGSISYRARLTDNNYILFGIGLGILNNTIDFSRAIVHDPNEASIQGQNGQKTGIDASFGATYLYKKLEVGFAMPQSTASSFQYVNGTDARSSYTLFRLYQGTLKYSFDLNKSRNIVAYPLVMIRVPQANAPIQLDVNGVIDWKSVGWIGATYKKDYGFSLNAGLRYKGLHIGYMYDIPSNSIASYAGMTNEILIGYAFGNRYNDDDTQKRLFALENKVSTIDNKVGAVEKQTKNNTDSLRHLTVRVDTLENRFNRHLFNNAEDLKNAKVGDIYELKNVNFATNSSELNKRSIEVLEELFQVLNDNPKLKIEIDGHTDDIDNEAYNYKLSVERAKAVKKYLEDVGIDTERLTYKGFGETQPLSKGKNSRARAINRRTEFKIMAK
jgi:type IX secretion system PorP/SprF family membrane protein